MDSPMPTPNLPDFAKQWMQQWKRAARELPRIRAAELRAIGDEQAVAASGVLDLPNLEPAPEQNGLVIQQRWFMRQRLLELDARE